MDAAIGDRDPTMDARIVHSVSVSNKKEQSTFHHKERSLQSAKDVQEHIHRREEKELIRQLTKLQDEKGRRHPEILGSRSRSRTHSRLSGSGPDSNLILQTDPGASRLSGEPLAAGKSVHNAAVGSSHLAAGRSLHHASLSNRRASNIMRGGPRTGVGPSAHHMVVDDLARGHLGGHGPGGLGGGPSRHTNIGISPQLSHLTHDYVQDPPAVHQPAGYGHTIKEYVNREGLNKKRPSHSYMEPRGSHRRASVGNTMGDLMKGSQTTLARSVDSSVLGSTGSRFLLNGPTADTRPSFHVPSSGQSLHRSGESMHRVAAAPPHHHPGMAVPSRFLISRLFGGQSVSGIAEEDQPPQDQQSRERDRRRTAHRSKSDVSDASSDSKEERVVKLAFADDDKHGSEHGSDTKEHVKDEGSMTVGETPSKATAKSHQKGQRHRGKSDHVVASKGSTSRQADDRQRSERKTPQTTGKSSGKVPATKSKKATSKSSHVVKPSWEAHPDLSAESKLGGKSKTGSTGGTSHRVQIPLDTLYELRSALVSSLHVESGGVDELLASIGGAAGQQPPHTGAPSCAAYDPSSNTTQNRHFRARVRALQTVNSQLEALRQKRAADPMSDFDPLEVLRCRYLRLSQSNVDTLTSMCREAGIEVGLHPHMHIDDIAKFVFDGPGEDKSAHPSSSSIEIKQVIV